MTNIEYEMFLRAHLFWQNAGFAAGITLGNERDLDSNHCAATHRVVNGAFSGHPFGST
jgi:hypothetical protein